MFVHQSSIHAEGFRSLAEGEAVEFDVSDNNGKPSAVNVTGPNGDYVKGAPYNPTPSPRAPREPRGHKEQRY